MGAINLKCAICNKDFYLRQAEYNRRNKLGFKQFCCSRKCGCIFRERNLGSVKITRVCLNCNNQYDSTIASKNRKKFCCEQCRLDFRKKNSIHSNKKCRLNKLECMEYIESKIDIDKLSNYLLSRANRLDRPIECTIDISWIKEQWIKQNGCCAITKLPLNMIAAKNQGSLNPYKVSLDRIDTNQGYTKENTQIVCLWANIAKSSMSMDKFKYFCSQVK